VPGLRDKTVIRQVKKSELASVLVGRRILESTTVDTHQSHRSASGRPPGGLITDAASNHDPQSVGPILVGVAASAFPRKARALTRSESLPPRATWCLGLVGLGLPEVEGN